MTRPIHCFMSTRPLFYETMNWTCHQTSNIRHTLVSNEFVDNSDVVGAAPVGAAPTTSSFST